MKESDGSCVFLGLHSTQLHKRDRLQKVPIFYLSSSSYAQQHQYYKCATAIENIMGANTFSRLCIREIGFWSSYLSLSLVDPQALYSGHGLSKAVVPPADLHAVTRVSHSRNPVNLDWCFIVFDHTYYWTLRERSWNVTSSRRYLQVEWEVRKGSTRAFTSESISRSLCRVPLQDNSSDCGLYLLQYVESFLQVLQTGLRAEFWLCPDTSVMYLCKWI